ncbi:rho-related gtp-binding protein isoform x4 [Limosa lapponica baueri]|uniref:Rho-related gtp-binding protein isoform x4 n=1 Tax=Limosa lapponica baueri TaxID=1758121 RepID=A0A2I0UHH8_LIMLA|nr:rho-related gtp-binding protein isoform x4 [Limosa lapponica baueri]
MSRSAPAGTAAAPFWEMLALLAREPGREFSCPQKHSLGSWPLKTLSLLECSGDSRLWQAYLEGLKKFLVFRKSMGMPAVWPIPEEQVRGFLAMESLYSSSKTLMYVAALSYLSKLTGNPDPLVDPITHCMMVGLKHQVGILRDKYLPITIEVLRSLLGALESVCKTHYECLLFRALFTVAFFGALRIGEMVAKHRDVQQPELLYLSDLQLMERRVVICLHNSPVAQERHVISLGLSGEPWVCPVLALRSYVTVRSQLEGPLFMHSDDRTVTKREFLTVFRWALRLLGLCPEQYGVHSFWLGTAVTAARCGYPREDITRLARWPCVIPERS